MVSEYDGYHGYVKKADEYHTPFEMKYLEQNGKEFIHDSTDISVGQIYIIFLGFMAILGLLWALI